MKVHVVGTVKTELLNVDLMTSLPLHSQSPTSAIIAMNDRLKEFLKMQQDEPTYIGVCVCVLGAGSRRSERCGRAEGSCCWIM